MNVGHTFQGFNGWLTLDLVKGTTNESPLHKKSINMSLANKNRRRTYRKFIRHSTVAKKGEDLCSKLCKSLSPCVCNADVSKLEGLLSHQTIFLSIVNCCSRKSISVIEALC
eukprot:TRINITY_DN6538_c0_g1_i2.p1 TRINITY_DN6538_c0_g1~~TRINITY_DN6538_c0_g1_i2.p1  ORF type:complete len:112 (-),score=12.67 TRINITY_DN6538_c0_g1_i2:272-607(-)